MLIQSEHLNPIEMIPGRWLFTPHRHTLQFDNSDTVVVEFKMTNILVKQGLADSPFNVPTQ